MKPEAALPLMPPVTPLNEGYWEGTRNGELRLLTCGKCATQRFPESPVCPNCLAEESSWQPVSGHGKLWSWIVMHQKYFPSYVESVPYLVAFIELDEGCFMIADLVDPPAELRIDMPVQVEFLEVDAERSAPVFRVVA